jgi:hypothetical protein
MNTIILKPGFTAHAGSQFYASIGCNGGSNQPITSKYSSSASKDNFESEVPKQDSIQTLLKEKLDKIEVATPNKFDLSQNYPNPFNPTTTIQYALKENVKVSLIIYNMLGQEVRNLVEEPQTAGFREVAWDGKNDLGQQVASGVYLYRIVAGNYIQTRRMVLLK